MNRSTREKEKEFWAPVFWLLVLWAVAIAAVILFGGMARGAIPAEASKASHPAPTEFSMPRYQNETYDKKGSWETVVTYGRDKVVDSCTTSRHISNTLLLEIETRKGGVPYLHVTGARFPLSNYARAVVKVDNNKPMPLHASVREERPWRTTFTVQQGSNLLRQLVRGSVAILVVNGGSLKLPLDGTSDAIKSLNDCIENGQEFIDEKTVQEAESVTLFGSVPN